MTTVGSGEELTEAERLSALELDLQALQEYCQQADLSPEQMRAALQPLVSAVNWSDAKQTARSWACMLSVLVVICLAAFLLFSQKPVQTTMRTYARIALVKILPYWDWTGFYYLQCLVENPMYVDVSRLERSELSCQSCDALEMLDRVSNLSMAEFTDNYLEEDRPVIVTDAMADWPIFQSPDFDRYRLVEMFSRGKLAEFRPCEVVTNLKARGDMRILLKKMSNPLIKKWFAQWENCNKLAAKEMRTWYQRPYFLPAMVDMSDSNWVAVSSNYTGNVFKLLPVVNDMVWMAQLTGTSQLRLTPRAPCTSICPEIGDVLHPGEILVFTDFQWLMEYLPGRGTDNIAIGTAGFWD